MASNNPPSMSLEIVSHCWDYSRLLTYQLSSLVLNTPKKVEVTMTVFHNLEDKRTSQVLKYFEDLNVENVTWYWEHLEKPMLFRRTIGRNMAALRTKADWIWFADCDQVFGENCIDSLASLLPDHDGPLVFPRHVLVTDHIDIGDPMLDAADKGPAVLDIDPAAFHPSLQKKAIGGIQIARGDVVREMGYCKDVRRFMKPARRFGRTHEDVIFRRLLGTDGKPMDIPNLFRITHKQKGRHWLNWKGRL